jgi:hypothetical protein
MKDYLASPREPSTVAQVLLPLFNDLAATRLQVLTARDTLTGLTKARFDNQLLKTNKPLLEFADQVAQD